MIVDSSAILSILFRESGAEALLSEILDADFVGIGSPTAAETGLVLTYPTAAVAAQPLLCLGEDFRKTDLELV